MAIKRLKCKAARVDLTTLGHELFQVVGKVLMTRKGRIAQCRKSALDAKRDAGAVQQDGCLEPFPGQADGVEHIDEADGALEGNGVEGDKRLLARFRLHILKNLVFVIDEKIAVLVLFLRDCRHVSIPFSGRPVLTALCKVSVPRSRKYNQY